MSLVYRFILLKRNCFFLYLHYYLSCENDYLRGKLTNLESKLVVLQKLELQTLKQDWNLSPVLGEI